MSTIEQTSFLTGGDTPRIKRMWKPKPDGATFCEKQDGARLGTLHRLVFALMCDGVFRSLPEIREAIGEGSETGISARLRDFRKKKFGGFRVESKRRDEGGSWVYRLDISSCD